MRRHKLTCFFATQNKVVGCRYIIAVSETRVPELSGSEAVPMFNFVLGYVSSRWTYISRIVVLGPNYFEVTITISPPWRWIRFRPSHRKPETGLMLNFIFLAHTKANFLMLRFAILVPEGNVLRSTVQWLVAWAQASRRKGHFHKAYALLATLTYFSKNHNSQVNYCVSYIPMSGPPLTHISSP